MFIVPFAQVSPATRPSQQFIRSLDRLFDDRFDRLFNDAPRADAPRVPSL
ncbi:MAG: hypothetical protein H7Z19_15035, partial [Chitinophagaceae bacterium]|nr:hypothetical protein [Rubrivivax sp.]